MIIAFYAETLEIEFVWSKQFYASVQKNNIHYFAKTSNLFVHAYLYF